MLVNGVVEGHAFSWKEDGLLLCLPCRKVHQNEPRYTFCLKPTPTTRLGALNLEDQGEQSCFWAASLHDRPRSFLEKLTEQRL